MDNPANRSLGELIADLGRDTTTIVKNEIELAQVEMSRIATEAAGHVAAIAVGAAILYAGLFGALATIVLGAVALGTPPALAAFGVTLLALVVGSALLLRARAALRRANLFPHATVRTIRETVGAATPRTHP